MRHEFTRRADGHDVTVVLDTDDLDVGADLGAVANRVAATIGLVGELLGEAVEHLNYAEAKSQAFEGERITELVKDEKTAEWKAKAAVRGDPDWLKLKARVAVCEGKVEFLRTYHSALRALTSMVRARVDLSRGERDGSTGLDPAADDHDHRADRVRRAMK